MPPTARVGHYELLGELATGGMATVYLARRHDAAGSHQLVAVKSIRPELTTDEQFVTMFLDEANLTARIKHPNVVPTLDVVSADGRLLIVMEYVEGIAAGKLIELAATSGRPLPPAVAVAVVSDVLLGLHAAHELADERGRPLSVVHRDVSPQNILIGTDGHARLLDFGIAKATSQRHVTERGEIKGKLAYMPPEQQLAEQVDRRADVYAAGVVLWELLVGRRLFAATDEDELVRQVFEGRVDPPSMLADVALPSEVDRVVLRALSRKREDRWWSAEQMAKALVSALRPASPAEVAEAVAELGQAELAERARHVRSLTHATHATSRLEREARIVEEVLSASLDRRDLGPAVVAAATATPRVQPPLSSNSAPRETDRDGRRAARRAKRRTQMLLIYGIMGAVIVLAMIVALAAGMRLPR